MLEEVVFVVGDEVVEGLVVVVDVVVGLSTVVGVVVVVVGVSMVTNAPAFVLEG